MGHQEGRQEECLDRLAARNRSRTRPIADSVPATVAASAVSNPTTWLTRKNERTNISLAKKDRYQRSDSPLGGKSDVEVEPNDTTITTTSGASSSA